MKKKFKKFTIYNKYMFIFNYICIKKSMTICLETGSTNDEDMNTIDSSKKNHSRKYRWKLLQFDENKRPPYWGTWRKKSLYVKPRRPFACDKVLILFITYKY